MAIEDYYRDLEVRHTVQAVDAYGDHVTETGEPFTIRGHVGKPSSYQAQVMAQRGISIDARLYAPVDAGVLAFDVIEDPHDGMTYQVVSDPRDAALRGHHVEADLIKLRGRAHAGAE